MRQQVTKKCHWVSQSYLKAFAADPEGKKIWRLGRTSGEPELKSIEKVAVRFHLYAPMQGGGTRNDSLERKLADLEKWFGEPIWAALCNQDIDLDWPPIRKMLALIVATTYVRNPVQFEKWKQMHRRFVEAFDGDGPLPDSMTIGGVRRKVDHSDWPAFRDADDENMKAAWNDYVGSAGDMAPLLLKMRMVMLVAEKPVFITSDNPVSVTHPSLQFRGLKDPESMISFPISPTRMLVLDNRHGEPDGVYYPLKDDNASADNFLTWRNALEHMFSPRHPDEVCAEIVANEERFLAAAGLAEDAVGC
jgi:hypothetical protein